MKTRLLALKSAVPPFPIDQSAAADRAGQLFQKVRDIERFMPIFVNTGIDKRYSCVPWDWYNESHGWIDRTELFVKNAVNLLEEVTRKLLAEAKLKVEDLGAYHDAKMGLSGALGAQVLPTTLLFDAEGREVWRYFGDLDWTSEEAARLLAEAGGGRKG